MGESSTQNCILVENNDCILNMSDEMEALISEPAKNNGDQSDTIKRNTNTINRVYYYSIVVYLITMFLLNIFVIGFATVTLIIESSTSEIDTDDEYTIVLNCALLVIMCITFEVFLMNAYKVRNDVVHLERTIIDDRYKRIFMNNSVALFGIYLATLLFCGTHFIKTYTYLLGEGCVDQDLDLCQSLILFTCISYLNAFITVSWVLIAITKGLKNSLFEKRPQVYVTDLLVVSNRTGNPPNIHFENCAVCLSESEPENITNDSLKGIIKLECGHMYHRYCINEWFNIETTCPNCRTVIIKPDIITLYERALNAA